MDSGSPAKNCVHIRTVTGKKFKLNNANSDFDVSSFQFINFNSLNYTVNYTHWERLVGASLPETCIHREVLKIPFKFWIQEDEEDQKSDLKNFTFKWEEEWTSCESENFIFSIRKGGGGIQKIHEACKHYMW